MNAATITSPTIESKETSNQLGNGDALSDETTEGVGDGAGAASTRPSGIFARPLGKPAIKAPSMVPSPDPCALAATTKKHDENNHVS
jgi:hypothetical protein